MAGFGDEDGVFAVAGYGAVFDFYGPIGGVGAVNVIGGFAEGGHWFYADAVAGL